MSGNSNTDSEARLDIKARGFWNRDEMAFFDVRIFNPFAKSYLNTKLDTLFRQKEDGKKTEYAELVIRIEHGSFTPPSLCRRMEASAWRPTNASLSWSAKLQRNTTCIEAQS